MTMMINVILFAYILIVIQKRSCRNQNPTKSLSVMKKKIKKRIRSGQNSIEVNKKETNSSFVQTKQEYENKHPDEQKLEKIINLNRNHTPATGYLRHRKRKGENSIIS